MAIKVKELNDDMLLNIQVNKSFYMMTKALSFYLYSQMTVDNKEEYMKDIMTKTYHELDDLQRSFYTTALLLAEIEAQAKATNSFTEKEILEPGDEGYKAPTEEK